jgi:hypothetical protein
MIEDVKKQNERLKIENNELTQKLYDAIGEKNDLQLQIDTTWRTVQMQFDEKQRELDEAKEKWSPPALDADSYKKRLTHELEIMHKYEIEAKDIEIERLYEKLQEANRALDLSKSRLETLKLDGEREVREIKQRHKVF